MNERENYLVTVKGEKPEWIPNYMNEVQFFTPQIIKDPNVELYGMLEACGGEPEGQLVSEDCYGIKWTLDDNGPMPLPSFHLFEEIEEWKEKFKIPDLNGYDWDKACEEDSAYLVPDKATQMGWYGPFTTLYNAMGFENAMISVAEDHDEVMALFDAMTTFIVKVQEAVMSRVKIDSIVIYDDIASGNSLFIAQKTYQKLVKPFQKRIFDSAKKMNPEVSLEMHCCGHCEDLIEDFVDIGSNVWQPAQTTNDLDGIRKKYGTKLVFNGAWDNVTICGKADATEEEVRMAVRTSIDKYGKNGGLIFWDTRVGASEDMLRKMEWVNDEFNKCRVLN